MNNFALNLSVSFDIFIIFKNFLFRGEKSVRDEIKYLNLM